MTSLLPPVEYQDAAGGTAPVVQATACSSQISVAPCDLSQLPFWVMIGCYSGRKPRVLHLPGVDGLGLPHTKCGWSPLTGDVVNSRLLNPARVRPCKRCWPKYRQPPPIDPPVVGVRATVTIDTSRRQDSTTRPVAVFGVRYHFMEPFQGNDDAFSPLCGTGGLLAGKGRLSSEYDAIESGASRCTSCDEAGKQR